MDDYPGVDVLDDEELKRGVLPYPPATPPPIPQQSAAPPVMTNRAAPPPVAPPAIPNQPPPDTGVGQIGASNAPQPNFPEAVRGSIGDQPNFKDYAVKPPTRGQRIGRGIAMGLSSFGGPENVRTSRELLFDQPEREAKEKYIAAENQYKERFGQVMASEKENRESAAERAKSGLEESQSKRLDEFEKKQAAPVVQVGDKQMQWNPDTKRYDIEVGAAKGGLTPERIAQRNAGLRTRYQIANPGKELPDEFTLKPGASEKDYEDIEKQLVGTENTQLSQAQRALINTQKKVLEKQKADEEELKMAKPIIGIDAAGNQVLVPYADSKKLGLSSVIQADAADVSKTISARHWLDLASKGSKDKDDFENWSINDLIDDLDRKKQLGIVASRWNDFLSGKVGKGDPEFTALRAKIGLSETLLMNLHVGNRGGSYLMEHFADLANAKKMDGATLRSGFMSEEAYARQRAMYPSTESKAAGKTSTTKTQKTVTSESTQPKTAEDFLKKHTKTTE